MPGMEKDERDDGEGELSLGERIAWHRRRRGLSREVLAGLVGCSADWLGRVERGVLTLDRLSVISALTEELHLPTGELLPRPAPPARAAGSPRLRRALSDYRPPAGPPPAPEQLAALVAAARAAFQSGAYARAERLTAELLPTARRAAEEQEGAGSGRRAPASEEPEGGGQRLLALAYQGAAMLLTRVGEAELAWLAADRGLTAARASGDLAVVGSLYRSLAHCQLTAGEPAAAREIVVTAVDALRGTRAARTADGLSAHGSLLLVGAVAAGRLEDRDGVGEFLAEGERLAARLGRDANHLWTAFGPTNLTVHRVSATMELGDARLAARLGDHLDTSALPPERRLRLALETARAHDARRHRDRALALLLAAEHEAPELVRHHVIARRLVTSWLRRQRGRPDAHLAYLAARLGLPG
ncbi:transcriptional regulator [Kitasatospora sp. MMS16-BH015]|uniref:helix-turn-helix domain-containing protein n=1 Tax=Kitasatospora sp. MMS16-BH015 TaxID=2018025 RepID=UPI000CA13FCE|nr:helix-turn-helix transcriptional regulator [Kitasatospora sp. MMS16-BH015]AUG78854.1 transcriptional regulator [Kitasatospora sp. MMS16-BH015]